MRQAFCYKLRQFYYKMRQYYKMHKFYYKMQQLLQNATFATKCISTYIYELVKQVFQETQMLNYGNTRNASIKTVARSSLFLDF